MLKIQKTRKPGGLFMRLGAYCLLILVLLFSTLLIAGCDNGSDATEAAEAIVGEDMAIEDSADTVAISDMLGRPVELSFPVERIVAIGPGALRLYCYVNGSENIVGIEQMDKDDPTGRPYLMAYPELRDLPLIGPGGPNNSPDAEGLLTVLPDVIFTMYITDMAAVDELQRKTGIPVIALSYGQVSTFDPDVYESLRIIGKVTGSETAAEEKIAFMETWRADLHDRTAAIPDSEKPYVYVGGLGARGFHGIESTQINYSLFNAVNARNVVDGIEQSEDRSFLSTSIMIDKEMLIEWNPDILFIDAAGFSMVQQDYQENPDFYQTLSAVQNDALYSQLPFNYYYTNIGTAIANAYYIGKVVYPEKFTDIEPEEIADEIYQSLLGQPLYNRVSEDYGGFGQLTLP
jgi:iron complex transport system substrate-binding protein